MLFNIKLVGGARKRSKYTGRIRAEGWVEVINGPYRKKFRNHFVDSALFALGYILGSNWTASAASAVYAPLNPQTMYIGSDTSTKTAATMTALAAPIGSAPGTAPNTVSTSIVTQTGQSSFTLSAVWNASTVTGSLGEMALYGTALTAALTGSQGSQSTSQVMLSRLSAADGDFSAFAINSAFALQINWTITFTFS